MDDQTQPAPELVAGFSQSPVGIHLLPQDVESGRSHPRFEERIVHSVEPREGNARPQATVGLPFERPLVWVGRRGDVDFAPGDTVRALWMEKMVQGWGPVAKAMCVDLNCERGIYRMTAHDAAMLAPHACQPHFIITKRT